MASGILDNSSDSPDESNDSSMEFFVNALHFLEDTATSSAPQTRRYTDRHREIGLDTLLNDCREYLRRPTSHDVARIFEAHELRHHMPGMLGSIDCTHVEWSACPRRLRGQYTRGDHNGPTIMLEITTSHDLWIWHAFFGVPGSNNDINVLNQSDLYVTARNGTAPDSSFHVNGRDYKRGLVMGSTTSGQHLLKHTRIQPTLRKKDSRNCKRRPEKMSSELLVSSKRDGKAISPVHIMDPPVQPVFDESVYAELIDEEVHHRLRYDLTEHVWAQDLAYLDD
uniref:uncharacterized protein LOC122595774 n=1 Tax=Erigeron canadensis TaxID=72917 RepID=UPI001CB8B132|nr:uncharacterized protein LOC122595774 [Erigeron canadensis]